MAHRMSLQKRMLVTCWAFIIPILLIRVLTTLYPVISVFYYSSLNYDMINRVKEFNWFHNYPAIFKDATVQQSIVFTLEYALCCLIGIIVLGIGVGLMLRVEFRGRKLLRTLVLIPWGMPMVVACLAGRWIFTDEYSIINDLIRRLISPDFHYPWLAESTGSKLATIILNIWKNTPFFSIIMLAAFQGIPNELFESARMDGANGPRILFSIMLPYVKRTLVMTALFVCIGQLNSFDIAYAMTRGGPGYSTSLMGYRLYLLASKNLDFGNASALSVVMFAITAVFGAIGLTIHNRVDY